MKYKTLFAAACLLSVGALVNAQKIAWKKYTSLQGAFTAEFPGEPKISETESQSPEGYQVKVKVHMLQEGNNVSYVLYNEMQPGVNILDDSVYLTSVTNQMLQKFAAEPMFNNAIKFENNPGRHFLVEFSDGVVEGKIVLRTNRAYFVVAFFPKDRTADRKRFLDSFHLLAYQNMVLTSYQSDEHFFKINFPSKPITDVEETESGKLFAYYAMDHNSGNNYSVAVDVYSPYLQFQSDSAVLANRVQGYTLGEDSVIAIRDVIVDGRPAKDLLIDQGPNNFKMRVRVFTNGRYSYTIFTFLPADEINSLPVNQFFDSFRFTARVPGNLLSDKTELMLHDIESTDTTVLSQVMPAIEGHNFEERHVSKIQELLKKNFDDDPDTTYSRKILLLQTLAEIQSASSVRFIKEIFADLQDNLELEYNALQVLVQLNTKDANDLLAELLPRHTPVKGNIWKYSQLFSFHRIDSAQSRDFFFKVLPHLNKAPFKTGLYSYMEEMLRAKYIQYLEVAAHKQIILSDLKSQYESFQRDSVYQYLDDIIPIIAYGKAGKQELEILKKLAGHPNDFLALRANGSLLRQAQKADADRINALAKDRYNRKDLFSEFKDFGLEKYFPKSYMRQDSIAVSEIYSYIVDEYMTPSDLQIVHEEELLYDGAIKKFYVVQFVDPEEGVSYRGVAGPYTPGRIEVFADLTGSYFEENRDQDHHAYLLDYISKD